MPGLDETARNLHFAGRALGVEWSRIPGAKQQVANLKACWAELGSSADYFLFDPDVSTYSPAERVALYASEKDHHELDRAVARAFWASAGPGFGEDTLSDPGFLRGWIEGALS